MQNIMSRTDFSEYRVTHRIMSGESQESYIPVVFKEWAHRETAKTQLHIMPLIQHLHNCRYKLRIREFNYVLIHLAMVSLHNKAASLSGRQ